jgi:hypothetical protein
VPKHKFKQIEWLGEDMSAFGDFENGVFSGVKTLAQDTFQGFVTQAENDAQSFMAQARVDLEQWTSQLASGDLSKDDFADLVSGEKDLATLDALTQEGLALIAIQRFRDGLINLVVQSAFKAFLPAL